ncbi:MAG: acylphosphatase [candidate division Zixibacteria bacterium]|nr:acylphosphatase [candidate division Zixibacteria bacterium]
MNFIRALVNVKGVVQGVGFRYWCLRKAVGMNIHGYVGNLSDGSVEVSFEGDRSLVEAFIEELKIGPTYSHVADLKIDFFDEPKGYDDFRIEMLD